MKGRDAKRTVSSIVGIGAVHFKHRPTYLILGVHVYCLGNKAV